MLHSIFNTNVIHDLNLSVQFIIILMCGCICRQAGKAHIIGLFKVASTASIVGSVGIYRYVCQSTLKHL